MPGTGRIPVVIRESIEGHCPPMPYDAGKGALLRLDSDLCEQSIASTWLMSRDVTDAPSSWSRHPVSCACCQGQNPLIAALHQLFLDRVRGRCPLFSFVVVSCAPDRKTRVRQMLEQDVLVRARYEF